MKGFSNVSRAATCASGVILESCSPESVVAKRRDSVQKPYGMTYVWGGRTANDYMASAGFTLIELLVVVLIIGILSAAALPSYRVAVGTSRVSTMYAFMRAVDQAQQHFYMQTNRYAATFDSLVVAVPAGFKKVSPDRISSNDMSCFIMHGNGSGNVSIKCTERKNNITLEKYHQFFSYWCWAGKDDTLANRICQNISGKDTPSDISTDGNSYYFAIN